MIREEFFPKTRPPVQAPGHGALGDRSTADKWATLVSDASGFVPDVLAGPHFSIRSKILLSHLIIIILMVGVNAVLLCARGTVQSPV